MKLQHVILGAGPAGVIAAETIRRHAPDDAIVVVGAEDEAPYSRMAIPYLLKGDIAEGGAGLRHAPDHFTKLRIDVRRGVAAESVDPAARTVRLADGSTLGYDRLLIATGASPLRPPIPGLDLDGVVRCWTLADAREIMKRATPGKRMLQLGAGFIGCIVMEALVARGVHLEVVEMGDRMVPRMMGPSAGDMIRRWCETRGVKVHVSTTARRIERTDDGRLRVVAAWTDGVEKQDVFDVVLNATGVAPNVAFLRGSGLDVGRGVTTDEHLRASIGGAVADGVFAAGDCAEALDLPSGQRVVSAIQPNAAEQARVAAMNMVARADAARDGRGAREALLTRAPVHLQRVPQINVLDTLGMISASFGDWAGLPGGTHAEALDAERGRLMSLQFKDDRVVGANAIGFTEHVGVLRGLIDGKVRLSPEWREALEANPTKVVEAYLACAQDQSRPGVGPRAHA